MTTYTCFEELEASVPMSQLRPSVAFSRCAAHLPHDVDELHGDELVRSMEVALAVHSKARVVLQCWVLLIMRRRAHARHEKDALYERLQQTTVSPQEKIRYRRGAMLLCHLLIEREVAEADSLLDRYLVDFYFPWSSAVNLRDDTFYLQADVVHWVRQALDYMQQNDRRMTAAEWLKLARASSSSSPTPSPAAPSMQEDVAQPVALADPPPPVRLTRSKDNVHTSTTSRPTSFTGHSSPDPLVQRRRKRQRAFVVGVSAAAARRELQTLRSVVERWAKRLRTQLLQAALVDDKDEICRVAEQLQAPPLRAGVGIDTSAQSREETADESTDDDASDDESGNSEDGQETEHSNDSDDSDGNASQREVNDCAVCESEPKKVEQVWNASCRHGFCGDCMLARLSQRQRRCMYCRAQIVQVVNESGKVFQHYDWTKWWKGRAQVLVSV